MNQGQGLRIIFAGTPDFAAIHLRALLGSSHQVIAIYTQPDRPAGRGKKLLPSPVKVVAQNEGIAVYQPQSLKDPQAQAELSALQADLMVVVAYGLLLPLPVLNTPKFGCINVHGSLLPRWRGAAPIQRAIEAGDTMSGVTIMQMDSGLDTGDMLLTSECPIFPGDTAGQLHDRLGEIGPTALLDTLTMIEQGQSRPKPQDAGKASYAKKLGKPEAEVDWRIPAPALQRKILAFNPSPVCFTEMAGERLKIYRAESMDHSGEQAAGTIVRSSRDQLLIACGKGALALTELQLPGKRPMQISEFMNGFAHRLKEGTALNLTNQKT